MPTNLSTPSITLNDLIVNIVLAVIGYQPCPVCRQTGALTYMMDGSGFEQYEPCPACDGGGLVTVAEAGFWNEMTEDEVLF